MKMTFDQFDRQHPQVWNYFKRFAFEAIVADHRRFSADSILHRIRWETTVVAAEAAIDPAGSVTTSSVIFGAAIKAASGWRSAGAGVFLDPHHGRAVPVGGNMAARNPSAHCCAGRANGDLPCTRPKS